jgi:hypothetical protein
LAHKYDLDCPTEAECGLYQKSGEAACQRCPMHLTPVEADPDPIAAPRLRFLFWLDSLLQVGMRLQADDVPMSVWRSLVDLKMERNRMERLILTSKDRKVKEDQAVAKAQAEARKQDGIPPPGVSLFPRKR